MPLHKDLTGTDLHVPGAHKTQHEDGGSDEISLTGLAGTPALGSATTAVTQSPGDNSTKVATTAYVDAAAALKASLTGATFSGDIVVPDEAYDATAWNGSFEAPTKNAIRDKIETLTGVSDGDKGDITVSSSGTVWTIDNSTVTEAKLSLANNTTANVSTSAHGLTPILPNDATKYLDGTGAYTVPAGSTQGALILLEQHPASSSASLDFTTWYSSSYDLYFITVNLVPATDAVAILLRMSTNGGSSYDATSGNYSYAAGRFIFNATGISGDATTATSISIDGGGGADFVKNTTTGGMRGTYYLFDPASTATHKWLRGESLFLGSAGNNFNGASVAGSYKSTTAVNAFQILASSGNLASGVVRVYGVAK